MNVEKTQQLLDSYFEALIGGGDFGQYLAEAAVLRFMDTGDVVTGREALIDAIVTSHTVQFAATPHVTNTVVGAGTAGVEIVFTGAHTDAFAGIPATGVEVKVPYTAFYTASDGAITEIRLYGLATGIVAQLTTGAASEAAGVG